MSVEAYFMAAPLLLNQRMFTKGSFTALWEISAGWTILTQPPNVICVAHRVIIVFTQVKH